MTASNAGWSAAASEESFLKSLAYALRHALQIEYQIEEREIAVELIGYEENETLLFWEAAEAVSAFGSA